MANTANPFYVDPMGGYGRDVIQGLSGIGTTYSKRREKQTALDRSNAAKQAMQAALNSGDPVAMRQVGIDYPEVSQKMTELFGITNESTKPVVKDAYGKVLADPANAQMYLSEAAEEVKRLGGDPKNMSKDILAFGKDPEAALKSVELRSAIIAPDLHKAYMDQRTKAGEQFTLSQGQQRFDAEGNPIASVAPKAESFTLAPGEQRIAGGKVVATGAPIQAPTIPPTLVEGLPEEVAGKASAAYSAAGGGKDGIAAYGKVVDQAGETERRKAAPKLIQDRFPNASPAELSQLQSAMDSAKTTDAGLKEAGAIREKQRQSKKAKAFQNEAVGILNRIIDNDQLGDVVGSIEGSFDTRLFSDEEAGLIADITEVTDILTADNMDLMTGVLSESDIAILKNLSSGGLNRKRPEKQFRERAASIRDKLKSAVIQTADERIAGTDQAPASGRNDGVLQQDASGNKAWVFPDGTYEEVQ